MRAEQLLIVFALISIATASNPGSSAFLRKEFKDELYKHTKFIENFKLDLEDWDSMDRTHQLSLLHQLLTQEELSQHLFHSRLLNSDHLTQKLTKLPRKKDLHMIRQETMKSIFFLKN